MQKHKTIIFLYGPTGVGKSDYSLALADVAPIEIVNCDVGQLYTPLSIGTAKPNWKEEKIPHHLFDVLDEPRDYTVVEYRKALLEICEGIWKRGAIPVVVGGSGFYIKSFFFPPSENVSSLCRSDKTFKDQTTEELWEQLQIADPDRAQAIHPNDRYRLERALTLTSLNKAISSLQPQYQDPGIQYGVLCLSRERKELYNRINERTQKMLTQGWIEEVASLEKSSWVTFLKQKKLIGYDVILNALEHSVDHEEIAKVIAQKTRHYAKRQMTFWRLLERNLAMHSTPQNMIKELLISDTPESLIAFKKIVQEFLKNATRREV